MALGPVLAFWLAALLLIVVPGADWAFVLGAGRAVLPAVGGLVAGYTMVTAVVAAGVGAAVAESPVVLTWLTVLGGLYLIWHGVTTFTGSVSEAASMPASGWGVFVRGVGVSGLNPKGLLIFLALLPQFTDPHGRWPVAGQIGVLGLTFTATCAVFYSALGSMARTVLSARPTAARTMGRVAGAAMVVIGATLLADRFIS